MSTNNDLLTHLSATATDEFLFDRAVDESHRSNSGHVVLDNGDTDLEEGEIFNVDEFKSNPDSGMGPRNLSTAFSMGSTFKHDDEGDIESGGRVEDSAIAGVNENRRPYKKNDDNHIVSSVEVPYGPNGSTKPPALTPPTEVKDEQHDQVRTPSKQDVISNPSMKDAHLVAVYELSMDTKSLEIHNAYELFNPIVFSHFYQRVIHSPHEETYTTELGKISKAFDDLDAQTPMDYNDDLDEDEVGVLDNTFKAVSTAPDNADLERSSSRLGDTSARSRGALSRSQSQMLQQPGVMSEGLNVGSVDDRAASRSKRIEKATKVLTSYFSGCIDLLNKPDDGSLTFRVYGVPTGSHPDSPLQLHFGRSPDESCVSRLRHCQRILQKYSDSEFDLIIRIVKVFDSDICNHNINDNDYIGGNFFPSQFCHDIKEDEKETGQNSKCFKKPSIFLPIGSTMLCVYLKAIKEEFNGGRLSSTILPPDLPRYMLSGLKLPGDNKYFMIVPKDKTRPQLRHVKKYRLDFPLQTLTGSEPFIDRFTYEYHVDTHGNPITTAPVPSTTTNTNSTSTQTITDSNTNKRVCKWLDIVVISKNIMNYSIIMIGIVGISSPCHIKDKENLHNELLKCFVIRNLTLFNDSSSPNSVSSPNSSLANGPRLFKTIMPQVQSACGFQFKRYTTLLGNYEEHLDHCLQVVSSHYPRLSLSNDSVNMNIVKFYNQIYYQSVIAIPIYPSIPPIDDPLPLPMIIGCYPNAKTIGKFDNCNGMKMVDKLHHLMTGVRSHLSVWAPRHPSNDLPTAHQHHSIYQDHVNLDSFNVDFAYNELILEPLGNDSFIVCFDVSKDSRCIVCCTSDLYLGIRMFDKNNKLHFGWKPILPESETAETPSTNASTTAKKDLTIFPCAMSMHSPTFDSDDISIFIAFTDGKIAKYIIKGGDLTNTVSTTVLDSVNAWTKPLLCGINVIRCYDENHLVIGLANGQVALWNCVNRNDSEMLLFSNGEDFARGLDMFKPMPIDEISSPNRITCLDINRKAGLVAAGSANGSVMLWQVEDHMNGTANTSLNVSQKLFDLKPHRSPVTALCFSSSGSVIYTGCLDGRIVIWDSIMGMLLRTIYEPYVLPCKLFEPREPCINLHGKAAKEQSPQSNASVVRDPEDEHNWVAVERCFNTPIEAHLRAVRTISLSPDSSLLTVVFQSGHVVFLDAHVNALTYTDKDLRARDFDEEVYYLAEDAAVKQAVANAQKRGSQKRQVSVQPRHRPSVTGTSSPNTPVALEDVVVKSNHCDEHEHISDHSDSVQTRTDLSSTVTQLSLTYVPTKDILKYGQGIRDSKIKDMVMIGNRVLVGRRGCIQVINLTEGKEESIHLIQSSHCHDCDTNVHYSTVSLMSSYDKSIILILYNNLIYDFSMIYSTTTTCHMTEDTIVGKIKGNRDIPSGSTLSYTLQNCITLSNNRENDRIRCYSLEKATGRYLVLTCNCKTFMESTGQDAQDDLIHLLNLDDTNGIRYVPMLEPFAVPHGRGHCTTVSVSAMKDGTRVVCGTNFGAVICYDIKPKDGSNADDMTYEVSSGKLLHKHLSKVTCCTIVDDGNYIITGSYDRTVIIYNVTTNTKQTLQHDNQITCLTVCPKTSILMVGCNGDMTLLWYWRTSELLGQLQRSDNSSNSVYTDSHTEPNDEISALTFSECEQVLITTTNDCKRLKFHFNTMSKDFQRIHSLAAAKQHGLKRRDHYSCLPMDSRHLINFIENHSVVDVKQFCKTNSREIREFLLLHSGWLYNKNQIATMSLSTQSEIDATSILTLLTNYDRIKDKLKYIFEVLPYSVILTYSKYGDLIDALLNKQNNKHSQITKQSVVELLNFYSFLLGTPAKEVDLDIDEAYWAHSCRQAFSPHPLNTLTTINTTTISLGSSNITNTAHLTPFSEYININKIISLCDTEPLLFANFVKTLRPCRNLDTMRSPFSRLRTRIPLSMNYLLRGSELRYSEKFWSECYESFDLTACDVVTPYFIPLKGISKLNSKFLLHIIQYTEDYGDYSLLKNPVVRILIEFKWQSFALRRFQVDFIILFLWNACVMINALLMRQYSRRISRGDNDDEMVVDVMLVLRCIIGIILGRFLAREVVEWIGSIVSEYEERYSRRKKVIIWDYMASICYGSLHYFWDVTNLIDLSVYTLVIIGIIYQTIALNYNNMEYKEYSDATFAVAMPFLAMNLLSDMAVHDRFGSYIAMMIVMVKSSMGVLVILALMIVSFAAAFMLSGVHYNGYTDAFITFDKALLTVYSYVFGGLSFVDMLHSDNPNISVILLVIFRFLVSIVLLNILIGIMATSQNQIMNHGNEAVLLAKANYIVTYENVTFRLPSMMLLPSANNNTPTNTTTDSDSTSLIKKINDTNPWWKELFGTSRNKDVKHDSTGSKRRDSMNGNSTHTTGDGNENTGDSSTRNSLRFRGHITIERTISNRNEHLTKLNDISCKKSETHHIEKALSKLDEWCYPWIQYGKSVISTWSILAFVQSLFDLFLFMIWSGAAIDPITERKQFPEYIQILIKDGVDLNTSTAKVTLDKK